MHVKNIRKQVSLLLALVALVALSLPQEAPAAQDAPSTQPAFVAGQILVKFHPGVRPADRLALHQAQAARLLRVIPGLEVSVVRVPAGTERAAVAAYARSPLVAYAELDYLAHALEVPLPDDEHFGKQWGMHNTGQEFKAGLFGTRDADIDAPEAWAITKGDPDVLIAILDTGIDQDHPDLHAKIVDNINFADDSSTVDDLYGHGTHVAGTAAAMTDNEVGVAGVGGTARLLNVKVLNDQAFGPNSQIAYGIRWAADYQSPNDPQARVRVINLSLGNDISSRTLEDAVKYAWNKGAVLTCAGGNGGDQSPTYPARYEPCIAVAATDDDDELASFSSWNNDWMDVAAPGENVYSTFPNHPFALGDARGRSQNYDYGNGTSMSAAYVAGLAALVWNTPASTSNQLVRYCIEQRADRIPGTGTYWIHGRVNADKAVSNAVQGTCSPKPRQDELAQ
jgi:thermitase